MASSTEPAAVQLSSEEQASLLDAAAAAAGVHIVAAGGALKNLTKGSQTVLAKRLYAGSSIVKDLPNPLGAGTTGTWAVADVKEFEAAAVYSGKNARGVDCGWLYGFKVTKDTAKVYVDCGNKAKYKNIDWADLKTKIEKAGNVAHHFDPATGTSICAKIGPKCGQYDLAAAFLG